jgi:hypothetical protein
VKTGNHTSNSNSEHFASGRKGPSFEDKKSTKKLINQKNFRCRCLSLPVYNNIYFINNNTFFPFALFLLLACCTGRTQISPGGTTTSVMVHLLSPSEKTVKKIKTRTE